nr:MAG TPA: hypothetical protein [Caudoviricetes sp.]
MGVSGYLLPSLHFVSFTQSTLVVPIVVLLRVYDVFYFYDTTTLCIFI